MSKKQEYRTQEEVECAIERFIMRGDKYEKLRDAAPFESPEYWAHHDAAVESWEKARALMPKGS